MARTFELYISGFIEGLGLYHCLVLSFVYLYDASDFTESNERNEQPLCYNRSDGSLSKIFRM